MPGNESDAKATFGLDFEADEEVPEKLAKSLEGVRARIVGATDSIKGMSSSLRSLRGDSAQVIRTKEELKNKIKAARDAVSRENLELLKQGVTFDKLQARSRKLTKEKEKEVKPYAMLKKALAGLTVAALAYKAVDLVKSGAEWLANAGNTTRAMGLMREAAAGSAENADNLGSQVDRLAGKLSTPKEKLNELAVSLTRALSGTQVTGQGIVDTFEAVARASDAAGDEVGSAIGEIVKRGKMWGRIQINPFETIGTGLPSFDLIAKKLAANTKTTYAQARQSLMYGVKADDGAKALLDATIERYGTVNKKKFLDLDVIMAKTGERIRGLVPTGWLDPVLANLDKLSTLFDKTTVTGDALSGIFRAFGKMLGAASDEATPALQSILENVEIFVIEMQISMLKAKKSIEGLVKANPGFFNLENALTVLKVAAIGTGVAIAAVVGYAVAMAAPFIAAAAAIGTLVDQYQKLRRELETTTVNANGEVVAGGGNNPAVIQSIIDNAPMPANARGGLVKPAPGEYVASVAPGEHIVPEGMAMGGSGGSSGASVAVSVHLVVEVKSGGQAGARELEAAAQAPSFRAGVLKVFEDAARSLATPTQTPVGAG